MSARHVPLATTRGGQAVAVTADQLATQAAMWAFARGGNAVDAAIAANATMSVTGPHLCGMGGDLLALVMTPDGDVHALNASGRAGSGADAAELRTEGLASMPLRHDVRSVTVPGCVDGWVALHERFGSLGMDEVLSPAIRLGASGFAASPLLVGAVAMLDDGGRVELVELSDQASHPGAFIRRPGAALALQGIAYGGRNAFYGGAFGEGLMAIGAGLFTDADLLTSQATWVDALRTNVFGVELCTIPPNSQGYLMLGMAHLAEDSGLPESPENDLWAHILIEAATAASHDRSARLSDRADGETLLDEVRSRGRLVDRESASRRPAPVADGDTTYLGTADGDGFAVSLIQSNASGFGSWLVEPTTGINLQNRGVGFSLVKGHPAEFGPRRRPPHTLSPALARRDGSLAAVLGTMGGDAQTQIVAQLVARLFGHDESPAEAVAAPRWVLRGPATGFDTWTAPTPPTVVVEEGSPGSWLSGLTARGHDVATAPAFAGSFGHAHVIVAEPNGTFAAAADPRARIGSAAAL